MSIPSQFQNLPDPALRASISRISQFCNDLHNTFCFISSLASQEDESPSVPPPPSHSRPTQTQTHVSSPGRSNSFGVPSLTTYEQSNSGFKQQRGDTNSNPELTSNNLTREYSTRRRPYAKSLPTNALRPRNVLNCLTIEIESGQSRQLQTPLASETVGAERESNPPSIIVHDLSRPASSERSDFNSDPMRSDPQESNPRSMIIHDQSISASSEYSGFYSSPEGIDDLNPAEGDRTSEVHPDNMSHEPDASHDNYFHDPVLRAMAADPSTLIFESPVASCSGSQPGIMSVLDQGIATSLQSPPASPAGVSNPRLSSVLVQQNNDQNRTSLNYDQEFEKKKKLILHELEIEINLGQQSVAEVDDLHRQAMDQHTSKYQRRRTEIRGFSNINPDLLSDEEVRELYFKKINNDIIEFRRTKLAVHYNMDTDSLTVSDEDVSNIFKKKFKIYIKKEFLYKQGYSVAMIKSLSQAKLRQLHLMERTKERLKMRRQSVAEDDDIYEGLISDDEIDLKYDYMLLRRWE